MLTPFRRFCDIPDPDYTKCYLRDKLTIFIFLKSETLKWNRMKPLTLRRLGKCLLRSEGVAQRCHTLVHEGG